MKRLFFAAILAFVGVTPVWGPVIPGRSIRTDEDIETDGRFVSNVAPGTPPLVVVSDTKIANLNADKLDGHDSSSFAFFDDLLDMAFLLLDLLDNPDPPCFDYEHRFVDCGNGTVTDTVTGLIYLKDANCFIRQDWPAANVSAASLSSGDCGLSDGSRAGDWQLLTQEEWEGIMAPDCTEDPKIVGNGRVSSSSCYSDDPWASAAVSTNYWSSTGNVNNASTAWVARLNLGAVGFDFKTTNGHYVWPVRGGQ